MVRDNKIAANSASVSQAADLAAIPNIRSASGPTLARAGTVDSVMSNSR